MANLDKQYVCIDVIRMEVLEFGWFSDCAMRRAHVAAMRGYEKWEMPVVMLITDVCPQWQEMVAEFCSRVKAEGQSQESIAKADVTAVSSAPPWHEPVIRES